MYVVSSECVDCEMTTIQVVVGIYFVVLVPLLEFGHLTPIVSRNPKTAIHFLSWDISTIIMTSASPMVRIPNIRNRPDDGL
jgi:hypothetical protein